MRWFGSICISLWLIGSASAASNVELLRATDMPSLEERAAAGDPFEGYNRAIFAFNQKADDYVLKPLAKGYQYVTPQVADDAISNFFRNLGNVPSSLFLLLQGKPKEALVDAGRFTFNTLFGFFGVADTATHIGFSDPDANFDDVLATWGVPSGPYLVLPLLGPNTVRGTTAFAIDQQFNPWHDVNPADSDTWLMLLNIIDRRADLIETIDLGMQLAIDPYLTARAHFFSRMDKQARDDAGNISNDLHNGDFESLDDFEPL